MTYSSGDVRPARMVARGSLYDAFARVHERWARSWEKPGETESSVYLLRSSGRCRPEDYRVVAAHRARVAVRLHEHQCLDTWDPQEIADAAAAGRPLPPKDIYLVPGEFGLTVQVPEMPSISCEYSVPDCEYVEAAVRFCSPTEWRRVPAPVV